MITTVKELLKRSHAREAETKYVLDGEEINTFPITAGNFFRLDPEKKWMGDSWVWEEYRACIEQKKQSAVYRRLLSHFQEIIGEIREIKDRDPKGYSHMEELRALRAVKKGVRIALEELDDYYSREAADELKSRRGIQNHRVLAYKNTVSLGSFADLTHQVESLSQVSLDWIRKTPLLLRNVDAIRRAVRQGEPIGLVGGPCLFGTKEVEIVVRKRDGSCREYDFSSGHRYDNDYGGEPDFADYVEEYASEIEEISFRNFKKGITIQEWESMEVLFAFAGPLGAKVAIPIPDMSYVKYLSNVIEPLDAGLRERTLEKFRTESRKIADMYLARVEQLRAAYPGVEVAVLHERDEDMCREFYKEREIYFSHSGLINRMTKKRKKTDAIFDYISMLALPYYLWGTPQVIQIDNLDETDSYRKCRKVHKQAFSLSAILYPERLSADGEHTIFNAPIEYKAYIE